MIREYSTSATAGDGDLLFCAFLQRARRPPPAGSRPQPVTGGLHLPRQRPTLLAPLRTILLPDHVLWRHLQILHPRCRMLQLHH